MSKTIIAPTQAGGSETFAVLQNRPVSLIADALAGSESVTVQILAGVTYVPFYQEGSLVQLSATHNAVRLWAPGAYKAVLSTTASDCGVYVGGGWIPTSD